MTLKGVARRLKGAVRAEGRSAVVIAVLSIPRPFEDLSNERLIRTIVQGSTGTADGLYGVIRGKALAIGLMDANLNRVGRVLRAVELAFSAPRLVIGLHELWVRRRMAKRHAQIERYLARPRHPSAGTHRAS